MSVKMPAYVDFRLRPKLNVIFKMKVELLIVRACFNLVCDVMVMITCPESK